MIAQKPESTTILTVMTTLADAQALATVEHASLGDSVYTPADMLAILARPEQHVYLAWEGEQAVGFCACFDTLDGPRLEVDMLGVLPDWRGRGIARRLVVRALDDARSRGVRRARAVVASGNLASRRALEHVGLAARVESGSPLAHAMLVYLCRGFAPQALAAGWEQSLALRGPYERIAVRRERRAVGQADLLRVQTPSYSGLWVERFEAPSAQATQVLARALAERAKQLQLDEVGYLAPQPGTQQAQRRTPRCLPWVREGYRDMGDYLVYEATLM